MELQTNFRPGMGQLKFVVVIYTCWVIWYAQNQLIFEQVLVPLPTIVVVEESMILHFFGVKPKSFSPKLSKRLVVLCLLPHGPR